MKHFILVSLSFFLVSLNLNASNLTDLNPNNKFVLAIRQVESGDKTGEIWGDNHRSYGPLQISKSCWKDSQIRGKYTNCFDYNYSVKVFSSYLKRYCPDAVRTNGFEIMSRTWNGGCGWRLHPHHTDAYWRKVNNILKSP